MNILQKISSFIKNSKIELRVFFCVIVAFLLALSFKTITSTYSRITEEPTGKSTSRIEGTTVYVDDLIADYHYLKGLNYAEVRNTNIPSGTSTGYYDNDYLVKVTIIYDGKDINNSALVGAVSPINNENANKYIYYKYYALERNSNGTLKTNNNGDNYIRIELIDNPFSKRPYVNSKEYGFNGWVCNQANDTTANLCENSTISFNQDDYTRYMDVPVNNESELTIHLNASWYEADVITSYYDITDFNSMTMQSVDYSITYTTETQTGYAYWNATYYTMSLINTYEDREYMTAGTYYKKTETSSTYTYNRYRTRCPRNITCYVYRAVNNVITNNSQYTGGSVEFVPNYRANSNLTTITINDYDSDYMNFVQNPNGPFTNAVQVPHYNSVFNNGDSTSGFYYKVSNPTTAMISTGKYYNSDGTVCTNANSCTTAYKLIQYNDDANNSNGHSISIAETVDGDDIDADKYYYLVTRDLNIFRYTSTTSLSFAYLEVDRPFTVTGTTVNGTTVTGVLHYPSTGGGWFSDPTYTDFAVQNDLVIENIKIDGPDTTGESNTALGGDSKTSQVIYANSNNLKIGRNVTSDDGNNYLIAESVFGGAYNNNISGTFRVILESGIYYAYHSGAMSGSSNYTLNETTILGSDYDRVTPNNNNLKFIIGLDGFAGGHHTAGSDSLFASFTTVKSGTLGFNSDGTPNSDNTAGMYIGGRASTCVNSLTGAKVEGGKINTIVGGYGYNGSTTTNSTYIGMSGGTVRGIYGGAGHSTTKGNRIINVTGGTVSYSVLGGSDSYSSTDTDDGVVQGSTLVYVGGIAQIGDDSTDELNGVAPGSVFGAGGGNSNPDATSKGTVYNSHVIINGGTIADSVYGGGNFGSTGTQNNATSSTVIDIYKGTIGNVYGGSKSAGFAKSDYANSSVIDINVMGGTIGNVYGGSNDKGTINGSIDIDITGGSITNNVYGGGRGNETTVSNSVDVTIGTSSGGNKPTIGGSVYGGSALGTVNGSSGCTTVSSYNTHVVVNSGVNTNIFGGGQGDDSDNTPYVCGNVTVDINGGTNTNVYGGNDLKGTPNGRVTVNVNGGTTTNAYAGGNKTEVTEPYINLLGGTVTNAFGGGNNAKVTTSHVVVNGATVTNVFGGSNSSGDVNTSNVTITSGTVTNAFGGNNVGGTTKTTNVTVNGGTVSNVYGGGEQTDVTTKANVTINSSVTNVFGGSDSSGTVKETDVKIQNGTITNVFGGNNLGGTTGTTNVTTTGGTVSNVYGGGEQTNVTTKTNVTINSSVTKVFGGSDSSGTVAETNVTINTGATVTSAFGGNNLGGTTGTTNVTVNGGTVTNVYGGGEQTSVTTSTNVNINSPVTNVFGGSDSSGTVEKTIVNINLGGNATAVYGGNNLGGTTKVSNVNIKGGVVTDTYGGGLKATTTTTNVNLQYGYSKNVYGGGNQAGATTTNVNLTKGYYENIFGGSNNSGNITNSYIQNTTGNLPNNDSISVDVAITESNINQTNNTTKASSENLAISINNTTGHNLETWDLYLFTSDAIFDSNWSGTNVDITNGLIHANEINQWYGTNTLNNGQTHSFNFNIHSSVDYEDFKVYGYIITGKDSNGNEYKSIHFENDIYANKVFGGNNNGGQTDTSHINITNGNYGSVYGGGEKATTKTTNVTLSGVTIDEVVYGGGDQAPVSTNTNVLINNNANILGQVFGGGNEGIVNGSTNIEINSATVNEIVYGGGNKAQVLNDTSVEIKNSATVKGQVYGGGNEGIVYGTASVQVTNSTTEKNIYGGGNKAAVAEDTTVNINHSTVGESVYGGGNAADVNENTNVVIENSSTISGSVFGGGNNGMVLGNATTSIKNSSVAESAYAGGNGQTATVLGNNKINIEGTTSITNHVFGGGNAAETGCESDREKDGNVVFTCSNPKSSVSTVNIAGGTIGGNVYGGANTSVVYGETYVNIGKNTISDNLTKGNIDIKGTVFGGGEANAAGSEDYDYSFISVTEGININIDASDHANFNIDGSIFGSGNASSSGGYSYINIKNYGEIGNPEKNISIQRSDIVTLDNSAIELAGAQDRTNKYKAELFTFSRIGHLKLKNGSAIYLEKGANLLENFSSLVDVGNEEHEATVEINKSTGTVTKNVDNRVYMYEGKNLNISDDESLATYGNVVGMSFFGMYKLDRNGNVATGLYSEDYNFGDTISGSELYYFSSGSYVVGKHKSAHDIYADGFYSNYPNEAGNGIVVDYIEPTPSDAPYYRWVIGETVETLELTVTASKYSTLGTFELQLLDYYHPNTEIHVLGVNFDGLASNINILPSNEIPRYANDVNDANTNFGLGMKTGTTGWITKGETEYSTENPAIRGTTYYKAENSNAIPSFIFYLYHSKNLTETKTLGTATISLMVVTPTSDLSNKIQRINVEVTMTTALYEGNNYEASIAPGAQYRMFANSPVNITSKSTFSTYFSLFTTSDTTIYKTGYTRSLVSTYALPVNTKITMIDFANSGSPEYYYYIIDQTTYDNSVISIANDNEMSYSLSKFIRMDSSSPNNTYNDAVANSNYYDSTLKKAEEEFIFIVDLKDTGLNADVLNKALLLECRDSNNSPQIPVLDVAAQRMVYNLYGNKEASLNSTANLSNSSLYIGQSTDLTVTTTFTQQTIGNTTIIDTNYYEQRLGMKLSLYNSQNQLVNGASLLGTAFVYNGVRYYPRQDGTVRFNIAESVANVSSRIKIDAEKSNIPSGQYKLIIETFASSDGIYYGVNNTNRIEKDLTIVNEVFGLNATQSDNDVLINKDTGLSSDKNNTIAFQLEYSSGLTNPNIRVSLYRRTYTNVYDYDYTLVDLQDYVTDTLTTTNEQKVYLVVNTPTNRLQYILNMGENLKTGTYQVRFSLYDGNNYVGHINKYIIIE